ncbi:non-heme iron oxygenase ferredoxin subunit [Candidatus Gottesmanbacteria bacterium]|nr:non-heme iron oxygenase ferredoxin subunit [Candidatus Gottesmanbacteria bacterium]
MADFQKVTTTEDLPPGKMKEFTLGGKKITVANTDGEYFAFQAECTHEHCALAGGFLDGYTLTCYCHGAQFDVSTGGVLAPPATSPITVYKTKVDGENILVAVD